MMLVPQGRPRSGIDLLGPSAEGRASRLRSDRRGGEGAVIANRGKLAAAIGLAVAALLVAPGHSNGQTDQAESVLGDAGTEAANLSVFSRITGRVAGEAVPVGASAEACAAAFERALLAVKTAEEIVTRRGDRVAYPLTVQLGRRGSGCELIVAPPPAAA